MNIKELEKYQELDDFLEDPENGQLFNQIYLYMRERIARDHISENLICVLLDNSLTLFDHIICTKHPELQISQIIEFNNQMYRMTGLNFPIDEEVYRKVGIIYSTKDMYMHFPLNICKVLLSAYKGRDDEYLSSFKEKIDEYLEPFYRDEPHMRKLLNKLNEDNITFHFSQNNEKSYQTMSKRELMDELVKRDKQLEAKRDLYNEDRRTDGIGLKVAIRVFGKLWTRLNLQDATQSDKEDVISTLCGFKKNYIHKYISGNFELTETDNKDDVDRGNKILQKMGIKRGIEVDKKITK